jgi:hypothetical protein
MKGASFYGDFFYEIPLTVALTIRFARGANNPPFVMRLQRMGHPRIIVLRLIWIDSEQVVLTVFDAG